MVVYQLYNTAVWDLIGPTVSLHGTYQELDERNVKKQFWNGDLRDGVGFYDFCCAFAETSSFGAQLRLQNQLIQFPSLQTTGKCSVLGNLTKDHRQQHAYEHRLNRGYSVTLSINALKAQTLARCPRINTESKC